MRFVRVSLIYFAGVFAVGFLLGAVRVTLIVPQLGVRHAELLELPFMVLASYLAARVSVRRFGPFTPAQAFGIGFLSLTLLVAAELGLTVVSGQNIRDYIASRDPVSGSAYLVSLLLFALMPVFVCRASNFKTMRQFAIWAILAASTATAFAQAVTETSGDPAVIVAIQTTVTTIDRDASRYRRTEHTMREYSAEGGTLVALYDGASLRKLSAELIGESGRLTQHIYYSADQPVFVDSVYEQYETKSRVEHRVYLRAGQPIRRIRTQSTAQPTELVSAWDPLPELLSRVQAFVACAAASARTCTASRR